ncbi:1391_t:CDS:2 [Diversispora eburnea]|uniref:1391_t:CDS:1 n=1 Tax=Diversispora eburnea TaxID=1213867 RepID=A0A9N9AIP0_9GLOM|nr:1391_t:CDS:2 [Diversispora eburnea]
MEVQLMEKFNRKVKFKADPTNGLLEGARSLIFIPTHSTTLSQLTSIESGIIYVTWVLFVERGGIVVSKDISLEMLLNTISKRFNIILNIDRISYKNGAGELIVLKDEEDWKVAKWEASYEKKIGVEIININNDPITTATNDSNMNPSIKVIIPTDPQSPASIVNLGDEFHVEWEVHGMTGDPELSIRVNSVLPTLPFPTYLSIWENPPIVKSSKGSYKFTIDPTTFQADTWYTITISEVNNENINGTSDSFMK